MSTITARAAALLEANGRCEWTYISGEQCQNTMSLAFHHRTYIRCGDEMPSDFSVLCPAHHLLADEIRKLLIGQRIDIVVEHKLRVIAGKCLWLEEHGIDPSKFFSRYLREYTRYLEDWCIYLEVICEGSQASRQAAARWHELMHYLSVCPTEEHSSDAHE